MARTARIKRTAPGVAYYHLMSRTNNKQFLFRKAETKTALVDALRRAAAFSGIELEAYVAMDNHFHVICKVTRSDEPVSEGELLRRVRILRGERRAVDLAERWKELRCAGFFTTLEGEQDRLRVRMNDISAFVKTFKEEFDRWYKVRNPYCGSVWSGRFKSTLVEGGRYLSVCKRYVALNPVRAGIVTQTRNYMWSWCGKDEEPAVFPGTGPQRLLLRRVVQIGEGKIFGSEAFVRESGLSFGAKLRSKTVCAHPVGELAYSSHGWRLAKKTAA